MRITGVSTHDLPTLAGWWDGGDTRRDYYVVQTREGQRAWAFLMPGASDGWMLHGWFA